MTVADLKDFDAAWAEEADEPVTVRLLGEEWACKRPSEVPAALLLRLDRLLLTVTTGDIPDDLVVDDTLSPESILRQLAGDDNVDAWLGRGLPYRRLMDVNRHLTAVYRGQAPGEATAANRVTRRAAKKKPSGSKRS